MTEGGVKVVRYFIVKIVWYVLAMFFGLTLSEVYAEHPLITDDAGTQGKGKYQLEFVGEYGHASEQGAATKSIVFPTIPVLTYGVADPLDAAFGISYVRTRTEGPEGAIEAGGVSDASFQLKWRFYEEDGLSFAVKPGITLATGDEDKGLGEGRTTYSLFFISTQQIKPWAVHLNGGYRRNENTVDERKDVWHASLAAEVELSQDIKGVVNIGVETNSDRSSNQYQEFILGGVVYSIGENADIDLGLKKGDFHEAHADYTFLGGLTLRF